MRVSLAPRQATCALFLAADSFSERAFTSDNVSTPSPTCPQNLENSSFVLELVCKILSA